MATRDSSSARWVRHHVPESTGRFVVSRAPLHSHGLRGRDLDVIHVHTVPKRLNDRVKKTKSDEVLDGILAGKVVNPVNLLFVQCRLELRVQGSGTGQVMSKRLFDDQPPPAAILFRKQVDAGELCGNPGYEAGRHRHIKTRVVGTGLAADLRQPLPECVEVLWLAEICSLVLGLRREPCDQGVIGLCSPRTASASHGCADERRPQSNPPPLRPAGGSARE